ncbi:MAG TPA: type II toxin-antitoxin system VapC family toxin [Chloroflexota bacterium]|nr:type II toxin-antitoxin system VapC family toxin [Chloroflexota bacterium]
MIDTNWVIPHLVGDPKATELLMALAADGIAISVITYLEAFQGTLREPDLTLAQKRLTIFLEATPLLLVTPEVARRCAQVRETLRLQNKRVRPRALDLLIAATALAYNLILVTQNAQDYDDIPGLFLYP